MALFCPNKSSNEWKALVDHFNDESTAMYAYVKNNYDIPSVERAKALLLEPSSVNYALRAANILASDQSEQVFNKAKKAGWSLEKTLTELQIPREQKKILLESGITDRVELLGELLNNYSYAVEINTSISKETYVHPEYGVEENLFSIIYEVGRPTQHYSNLTVNEKFYRNNPDWEYKEQRITTPLITPSIKGHAQFAQDNDIGWFRAWYNKKTGEVHVLEIQSDLFQKGRKEGRALVWNRYLLDNKGDVIGENPNFQNEQDFFNLLAKDSNWVTFFIKSIIQDSAKKGYEKVLFPSGNTASKVEGHTTLEEFREVKENRMRVLEKELSKVDNYVGNYYYRQRWDPTVGQDIDVYLVQYSNLNSTDEYFMDDDPFKYVEITEEEYDKGVKEARNTRADNINRELKQLEQELEEIDGPEGFGALKPIYNFYENTVANILKKQGHNPVLITDEYGNTWSEITIKQKDLLPLALRKVEGEIKQSQEHRDAILEKYFDSSIVNEIDEPTTIDLLNRVKDNLIDESLEPVIDVLIKLHSNAVRERYYIPQFEILDDKSMEYYLRANNIKDDVTSTVGVFNPNNGMIYINADSAGRINEKAFQRNIIHELVHAYTLEAFSKLEVGLQLTAEEKTFYDKMNYLYNLAINKAADKKAFYGYTNVKEFISEIMVNPKFVNEVKGLKFNIFKRIIDAIVNFFNELVGIPQSRRDIYTDAFTTVMEYMSSEGPFNQYLKQIKYDAAAGRISISQSVEDIPKAFQHLNKQYFDQDVLIRDLLMTNHPSNSKQPLFIKRGNTIHISKQHLDMASKALSVVNKANKNTVTNRIDPIVNYDTTGTIVEFKLGKKFEQKSLEKELRDNAREANEDIAPIEQRDTMSNMELENREDLNKKIDILRKVFTKVEDIIEDPTGEVMGDNIAQLEDGGKVMRINPNKLTKDAVGHEFGHILIDSLGGLENALIRSGLAFLEGTPLEAKVNELYADVDEVTRKKELLAQAIGEDFSRQFDEQKLPKWQQWLLRFYRRVKELLGLESNEVRQLTEIMFTGEEIDSKVEELLYEKRDPRTLKPETSVRADHIRELARESIKVKQKIYGEYGRSAAIEKLNTLYDEITNEDKLAHEALISFVKRSSREIDSAYKRIKELEHLKAQAGENPFTAFELRRLYDYVTGYSDVLERVRNLIIYDRGLVDKANKTLNVITYLDNTITKIKYVQDTFLKEGFEIVVDFLLPHFTRIEAQFKLDKTKEFKTINKEFLGKWKKSEYDKQLQEYLLKELNENEELIKQKSRLTLEKELALARGDINKIMAWAENILDSNDSVISALVKSLVKADHEARQEKIEQVTNMVNALRELEQSQKSGIVKNEKNFYDFMLEKLPDGTYSQRYVTEYYSNFWDEFNKFKDKVNNTEGLTDTEKANMIRNWKETNAPLDKKGFSKAIKAFIEELKVGYEYKGRTVRVSEKEVQEWNFMRAAKSRGFVGIELKPITEVFNEDAAEAYINWLKVNTNKFRKRTEKWHNPQWSQLQAMRKASPEDPRIKFYDYVVELGRVSDEMLPYKYRLGSRLPSVTKDLVERVMEGQNIISAIKDESKRMLGIPEDETERGRLEDGIDEGKKTDMGRRLRVELQDEAGNLKMFLPIYYSNIIGEEQQSYDIATIYTQRFNMATDYAHKYNILPEIELTRQMLDYRKFVKLDSDKNPVINALFADENKTKEESFSKSNLFFQLDEWMKAVVYGQREEYEGTWFKGLIDKGKAANLLNKYTALNLLGLNFVQGTANYTLGESMQIIEAFAGEHYTMKDYLWAKVKYNSNLFGILGDIGLRRPTNIINLINERYDLINDFSTGKLRKNTRFREMMSTDTLFFTAHAGEHMMQSKVGIAMLRRIKPLDSEGNEIKRKDGTVIDNMFDAFRVENGVLILDERVANHNEAQFEMRAKRILSRMHGEYSDMGRVAMQRYALGRMAYMFRKFVIQGYKRRWETGYRNEEGLLEPKYNEIGEFFSEGAYISFGRFVKNIFKDLLSLQMTVAGEKWDQLHDYEKANIKRTVGEIFFLMVALILGGLFAAKADDDEEWIWGFLAYQALRYKSELLFFTPKLDEAMSILRSPAASMSFIENTIKLTGQIFDPFDTYKTGDWEGRLKIEKTLTNMVPVYRQYYRITNVKSQIPFFNQTQLFKKPFMDKDEEKSGFEKFKEYYDID